MTPQILAPDYGAHNANAYYAHSLTQGAAQLVQTARFDNVNTFYQHALYQGGGPQTLVQTARFDNVNTFFAHVLLGGVLPSGTKQVYCSGDGTYRVFAFTTTETAFVNGESPHVAVTTKQLVAQVKRRPIISNTES